MKQLYISEVKNGWIVRTSVGDYVQNYAECYVYATVEELQQALPSLLQASTVASSTINSPATIKTTAL